MNLNDSSSTTPLSSLPRRDQDPRDRRRRRGHLQHSARRRRSRRLAGWPRPSRLPHLRALRLRGPLRRHPRHGLPHGLAGPAALRRPGCTAAPSLGRSAPRRRHRIFAILLRDSCRLLRQRRSRLCDRRPRRASPRALFLPRTFEQAYVHTRLWWPDLIILALGAVILTVSFVRSESKPFLPSVILAYEFFLPSPPVALASAAASRASGRTACSSSPRTSPGPPSSGSSPCSPCASRLPMPLRSFSPRPWASCSLQFSSC